MFLEQHVQVLVAAVGAVLQGLQRESSGAMAKSLQLLKDWYLLVQPQEGCYLPGEAEVFPQHFRSQGRVDDH